MRTRLITHVAIVERNTYETEEIMRDLNRRLEMEFSQQGGAEWEHEHIATGWRVISTAVLRRDEDAHYVTVTFLCVLAYS